MRLSACRCCVRRTPAAGEKIPMMRSRVLPIIWKSSASWQGGTCRRHQLHDLLEPAACSAEQTEYRDPAPLLFANQSSKTKRHRLGVPQSLRRFGSVDWMQLPCPQVCGWSAEIGIPVKCVVTTVWQCETCGHTQHQHQMKSTTTLCRRSDPALPTNQAQS